MRYFLLLMLLRKTCDFSSKATGETDKPETAVTLPHAGILRKEQLNNQFIIFVTATSLRVPCLFAKNSGYMEITHHE